MIKEEFFGLRNPPSPPTLRVEFVLINDGCGTNVREDFSILLDAVPFTIEADTEITTGPHTLLVDNALWPTSPNYSVVWSGDCDVNGDFTASTGDVLVCTVTMDDQLLAITAALACDFLGNSGAPGEDYANVTRDWTHTVTIHGPCLTSGGVYTASIVSPVSGVTFPISNIVGTSTEYPGRCANCDRDLGRAFTIGSGMHVALSVPLSTVIRIRVTGPAGSAEADTFEVVATGNPGNAGTGGCP